MQSDPWFHISLAPANFSTIFRKSSTSFFRSVTLNIINPQIRDLNARFSCFINTPSHIFSPFTDPRIHRRDSRFCNLHSPLRLFIRPNFSHDSRLRYRNTRAAYIKTPAALFRLHRLNVILIRGGIKIYKLKANIFLARVRRQASFCFGRTRCCMGLQFGVNPTHLSLDGEKI